MTQSPQALARSRRKLKRLTQMGLAGALGINALLIEFAWGDWPRVWWIIGLLVTVGALNVLLGAKLMPRIGVSATDSVRATLNLTAALVNAHVLGWPVAAWLYLPFSCVLIEGGLEKAARIRLLLVIAIWNAFAFAAGATVETAAAFTGIGLFCFMVTSFRLKVIEEMLAERHAQNALLEAAHEELKVMHVHALAQEKLAGLGLLAAGIAHEINNPMSYVTSNLNGLLDDLKASPQLTAELIEQRDDVMPGTLDGVRRVNAIVSDLRRFASGEAESPMRFDLRDEIEAAARIVRPQLKPNQTIRVDFPESLMMFGMARQMGQVLLNLLVNSTQALAEAGEVVAHGKLQSDGVAISIVDNGSGMTQDTLEKLFQPFFTTKEVGKGTGLGLSVVHGIVKSHGGKINVTSQVGQGSTFTVTIPTVHLPSPSAC